MNDNQSIKDTLDVIRKALEDDEPIKIDEVPNNILILNQLVKEDGTIDSLKDEKLDKKTASEILNNKLNEVFDHHLTKWLDTNIPNYLEKYFKKKRYLK